MRALVIGGNGLLGSHLVDSFLQTGWEITILDRRAQRRFGVTPSSVRLIQGDISRPDLVKTALEQVDLVFYLPEINLESMLDNCTIPDSQVLNARIEENLLSSLRLIEACRQRDIRKFVLISSGDMVGSSAEHARAGTDSNVYALSPRSWYNIFEKYLSVFNRFYGLNYSILRPSVPQGLVMYMGLEMVAA